MQNIPLFAASGTKTSPPALTVTSGYFPLQVLPAEQLNYFLNGATQSIQEWVNLITLAGLTPGPTQQGWTAISGLMAAGFTFIGGVNVADAALDTSPVSFGQFKNGPGDLYNMTIAASVGANALTVSLKQQSGANPSTGASQVAISFRSATANSGVYVKRTVTSALSLTIPSGATMGFSNGVSDNIYVYAIDNNGTVELAVSTEALWDEALLWDTTVMNTSSDSRIVLYSASARSGVAIRLLGRLRLTEATAGTWATDPSNIAPPYCDQSGEIIDSGTSVSLSTGTTADIISITVPPGKWDLSAGWAINSAATTNFTVLQGGISLVSATLPTAASWSSPGFDGSSGCRTIVPLANAAGAGTVFNTTSQPGSTVPTFRVNIAVATTYYLVIQATFTVSACSGKGWIQARRITK